MDALTNLRTSLSRSTAPRGAASRARHEEPDRYRQASTQAPSPATVADALTEPERQPAGQARHGTPRGELAEKVQNWLDLCPRPDHEVQLIQQRLALASGFQRDPESERWLKALLRVPQTPQAMAVEQPWEVVRQGLDVALKGQESAKLELRDYFEWWRTTANTRDVICMVGPPGVGKTTLVKEMGAAFGRPVEVVRLDEMKDKASLTGYTPTWKDANLGAIVEAICRSKVSNPIIFLDEVDKMTPDSDGIGLQDALNAWLDLTNLSVENPYLGLSIDLSQVTFVLAANSLEGLSPSLRDRLEGDVIEMNGYTQEELKDIIPSLIARASAGLPVKKGSEMTLADEARDVLLERHTQRFGTHTGVRVLERWLKKLLRRANAQKTSIITAAMVQQVLDSMRTGEGR